MKLQELLRKGTEVGDDTNERCYVPVFRTSDTSQDTWYLGNIVMQYYYIVFDMTPLDERQ